MNTKLADAKILANELISKFDDNNVDLIIAPPFTHIDALGQILKGSKVKLSSQNIAKENLGAFTGEISGEMLKPLGVEYAIIGHSERRAYYNETDADLAAKTKKTISLDITPIFCVGENLNERESDKYFSIIENQIKKGLFSLESEDFSKVIIAYEPVWAIGTGKTASPEQAQEIHAFIRDIVKKQYNSNIADNLSILYGGSCKPSNAKELFTQNDIDGGLIGGAALNSEDFIAISKSF